jgi:hypothetical protein
MLQEFELLAGALQELVLRDRRRFASQASAQLALFFAPRCGALAPEVFGDVAGELVLVGVCLEAL